MGSVGAVLVSSGLCLLRCRYGSAEDLTVRIEILPQQSFEQLSRKTVRSLVHPGIKYSVTARRLLNRHYCRLSLRHGTELVGSDSALAAAFQKLGS